LAAHDAHRTSLGRGAARGLIWVKTRSGENFWGIGRVYSWLGPQTRWRVAIRRRFP